MKNIDYELKINLDLLNNITGKNYQIDGLNLMLDGQVINSFSDIENFASFVNIQYTSELLKFCGIK